MATQDLDDLQLEAPPAKRTRTCELDEMDSQSPKAMAATLDSPSILNPSTRSQLHSVSIVSPLDRDVEKFHVIPGLESNPNQSDNTSFLDSTLGVSETAEDVHDNDLSYEAKSQVQDAETRTSIPPRPESPSITSALEAMLGGLTPPTTETKAPTTISELHNGSAQGPTIDMEKELDFIGTDLHSNSTPISTIVANDVGAAIQNILPTADGPSLVEIVGETGGNEDEFELDSSPIESSSAESDSDDSSSEDSEGDDAYELLGPEEQARILMEGDGGSDDEGGGKGTKGPGGQLRTKNEVPEEIIPRPDVIITQDMTITHLGAVEAIVENVLLIKANTSGEYRVLESGSVLCLENRTVVGVVSETLGRVQQPFYSVRFTKETEISEAGLVPGTKIFYSEQHSSYVFTQSLKAFKGSDASNLHDEEVGDEEVEFSDDEAEMEHKRRIKQRKSEKRGGRMQQNGGSARGGHPLQQEHIPQNPSLGLNYDDAEDDGPYKTLSRPAGFAESVGRSEAPQEGSGYPPRVQRMEEGGAQRQQSREFHGGRGRGDRGRGRGHDRGRGRGGFQDRRGDGYSQPPQAHRRNSFTSPPQDPRRNSFNQANQQYPNPQIFPQNNSNFSQESTPAYSPQQHHFPPPFPQPFPQQPYTSPQNYQPYPLPGWPQAPHSTGTYINPAFFPQQQLAGQAWNPPQPQQAGQEWAAPPQNQRNLEAERAFAEAQEKLTILKNLGNERR